MAESYKIEIFLPDNDYEFIWCIIQTSSTISNNVGHGVASSYLEAATAAYNYWEKSVCT